MVLSSRSILAIASLMLFALAGPLTAQAQLLEPLSPEELEAIKEQISGSDGTDTESVDEPVFGGLETLSPAEVEAIWDKIRAAQGATESAEATD
ncbi:MAG: hypothetical protein F6J87_16740 [Spirulina sp. SIO3F2]|nr:hypothetical protein [Spirulina sp. SIO3F2]